jgi:hypothetical protein
VRRPESQPLRHSTPIWLPATVPASGRSTYVTRKSGLELNVSLILWQILRVVEIEKTEDVKRPYIKQLITKGLTFPLPHRVPRISTKKIFSAKRPSTFA